MVYLLYYANRRVGSAAVKWFKSKRPEMHGDLLEDVIALKVNTPLSPEELFIIKQETNAIDCVEDVIV